MIRDLEETLKELKNNFEISIKCKNCGSNNVSYSIDDEYGNEEEWLGQSIYIKCNDCGKFFID